MTCCFFNGCYGFVNPDTVNMRLNDLAQDAKIELGNLSLSWHCFRKMIISTAKNLSIDPDIIKIMCGKAVEKSMLPYLNGINVRTAFTKLQTELGITTLTESSEDVAKTMGKEIMKLSGALSQVENENFISKTRIENLQKSQTEQSKTIDELETKFEAKLAERVKMLIDFINAHGQETPETKEILKGDKHEQ
jgi:DNA-directed RNA polymerase subunit N (RpoN/RPB10)